MTEKKQLWETLAESFYNKSFHIAHFYAEVQSEPAFSA